MRGSYRAAIASVGGTALLVGTGCVSGIGASDSLPARIAEQPVLFSAGSPFNQPITSGATVDRRSKRMIRLLRRSARHGFAIGWRKWSVPVYFVEPTTPRTAVRFTAKWRAAKRMVGVPIPDGARPDPGADGSMAIIDQATGCEFDFWQARKKRGKWRASWGNAIRTDGDGVFPHGLSARASGFALTAGLIWPSELAQGEINHALVFSYDFVRAGGPVPPATENDDEVHRRAALPDGARLQLDPALDIDSLGLTGYQRTIARALQTYGMFLADSGGGVSLYARNPLGMAPNSYSGLLPNQLYPTLEGIPIDRMRVLQLPPQVKHPDSRLVDSGCGRMKH